ncbi:rhamnogalacturonan lyase family protein [Sphingomonas sp. H160509]|uniref:rhamnogalacturonan lyase family protein n=1 Tax=Sphingomonas sp. H160509 TaxID=2955313 RepID=UPI00406D229B
MTPYPTRHRLVTLMQDPVYRAGVAWQNTAYNQPPHLGYFPGSLRPSNDAD